jgi:hypothetical protein
VFDPGELTAIDLELLSEVKRVQIRLGRNLKRKAASCSAEAWYEYEVTITWISPLVAGVRQISCSGQSNLHRDESHDSMKTFYRRSSLHQSAVE